MIDLKKSLAGTATRFVCGLTQIKAASHCRRDPHLVKTAFRLEGSTQ
jgi:hypothetical protein